MSDAIDYMSDERGTDVVDTGTGVERVLEAARAEGLIPSSEKDAKASGRIHRRLLDAAKERTGIKSETALLEYALAKVALEADFGAHLAKLRGR